MLQRRRLQQAFPDATFNVVGEPTSIAAAVRATRGRPPLVASGTTGPDDVRDARDALERGDATLAILVALEPPTGATKLEAQEAGHYHSPGWGRTYPRVQLLTIEELLNGEKPQIPPAWGTFKQAERVKEPQAEQGTLDLGAESVTHETVAYHNVSRLAVKNGIMTLALAILRDGKKYPLAENINSRLEYNNEPSN